MKAVNIYLNFNGNTEEAFNFYKSVFGGEFKVLQRFKDAPACANLSENDANKIMHISLPLSSGNILMATDTIESMPSKLSIGNNFSISVSTDSEVETDNLFAKLSDGGSVIMSLQYTFWGAYFGILTDKFGIQWMFNYDLQLH